MTTVVRRARRRSALSASLAVALVAGLVLSAAPADARPDALLSATAAAAPTAVTATGIADPAPCTTMTGTTVSTSSAVTVRGSATATGPVDFTFAVYRTGERTPLRISPTIRAAAGAPRAAWTVADLPDGSYWYRVRAAADGVLAPATTRGDARFVVDTAAPAAAPVLDSTENPAGFWGMPPESGVIRVDPNGDDSIVGYAYSWTGEGAISAPTAADCSWRRSGLMGRVPGPYLTFIPEPRGITPGPHTVWVRSVDASLRMGPAASYDVLLAPAPAGVSLQQAEYMMPRRVAVLSRDGRPVGPGSTFYDKPDPSASAGGVTVLLATGGDPLAGPEYRFGFKAPMDADYAFSTRVLQAPHYGLLQFGISAGGATSWFIDPSTGKPYQFDGYSPRSRSTFATLGVRALHSGRYELVVKVVGKNPLSTSYDDRGTGAVIADHGYSGSIDNVLAVPVTNRRFPSFAAARNNNGVEPDGRTSDMGPSTSRSGVSENALRRMGEYSRTSPVFTTGGVRFTMPTSYTYDDNVVGIGQRLPIGGASRVVKRVELLATAACGAVGGATSQQFGLHFSDGSSATAPLPHTPDFMRPRPTSAQLASWREPTGTPNVWTTISHAGTMPYSTLNGQVVPRPVQLYRITVPVTSSRPLAAITLPYTGTSLSDDCDPALHVFAITYVS